MSGPSGPSLLSREEEEEDGALSSGPHTPPDGDGREDEEIIAGSGEKAAFSRGEG